MLEERMKKSYGTTYDLNPEETGEWLEAYEQVLNEWGEARGQQLLSRLQAVLQTYQFKSPPYDLLPVLHRNAVITSELPSDLFDPSRLAYRLCIRWNAVSMVVRAQRSFPELGGHIASCLSIADVYDIGFEYFFRGASEGRMPDCVYFQGHSSPIIYARSFVEGELTEEQLDHFRRETAGKGLSSYPHPYLMPNYWQFPTVSMGLGLLQAIHQARILKYLDRRKLKALGDRRVWSFVGDAEMREPESLSALLNASIDKLSHMTVILNANLQGLDGLCHGSGSVIREYASLFSGNGWRVIKVIWNQAWLDLFASEPTGTFEAWVMSWVDGDHQNFYYHGPSYLESQLLKAHPELTDWLSEHRSKLVNLLPGGHDVALLYQAYEEARCYTGGPSVILVQTIKGHQLPMASQNIAHQKKSLSDEDLLSWAHHCGIPLTDAQAKMGEYYKTPAMKKRFCLSETPIPSRTVACESIALPSDEQWQVASVAKGKLSTTTSFVRVLSFLLRTPSLRERIVPVVADEARTFGMEGLFKQIGVYEASGSQYESHDLNTLSGYRESEMGQLLQEGVNEAGALASWLACATSYSVNHYALVPFYIFYSMFGFQRVMDLIWASADSRARGFLLGATAGRTSLAGEGLQHADGHSLLLASVVPSVVSYDPAWHGEVAVIVKSGLERMITNNEDLIVYMTLVNESIEQVALPEGVQSGILSGMYLFESYVSELNHAVPSVSLLGAGALFHEAYKVYLALCEWGWNVSIYSVTSFSELRRNALELEKKSMVPYVTEVVSDDKAIVVAVSDYVTLVGDMIRPWVKGDYSVLGTDGFGLSDTREALRAYFEVNAQSIMSQVLKRALVLGHITEHEHQEKMLLWRTRNVPRGK